MSRTSSWTGKHLFDDVERKLVLDVLAKGGRCTRALNPDGPIDNPHPMHAWWELEPSPDDPRIGLRLFRVDPNLISIMAAEGMLHIELGGAKNIAWLTPAGRQELEASEVEGVLEEMHFGSKPGTSLHAARTDHTHGFMSAPDKTKLDAPRITGGKK